MHAEVVQRAREHAERGSVELEVGLADGEAALRVLGGHGASDRDLTGWAGGGGEVVLVVLVVLAGCGGVWRVCSGAGRRLPADPAASDHLLTLKPCSLP
ncbi:hypothetical protein GCM10009717_32670 [Agromyces allii]|uniref:Uncharacterized protein n=1 Tax=Agromyces allii TaxID=393607 RepID=A0ABP5CFS5_9MICO